MPENKFNINEFLKTNDSAPYRWEAKTFKIVEVSRDKIRITGIAVHAGETSKNQNKYVREALIKATNTWIGKPLIINHNAKEISGNIELMDFDESTDNLTYTALVNKQPYVNMIRDKSTAVRGVSIGADYLAIKCSRCGNKFTSEEEWYQHATEKEFMRNLPREPHGIIGKDLSLVLAPETPGCQTTVGIAESAPHYMGIEELFNMVISESKSDNKKMEMTETKTNKEKEIEETKTPQSTPTPKITEATTPTAVIPKLIYEAEQCTPFEQCIKDGGSPEECALKFKETVKRNSNNKALVETVNLLIEAQKVRDEKMQSVIESLQTQTTTLASNAVELANSINKEISTLKETVSALPKDDLSWKEADKQLSEVVVNLQTYVNKLPKEPYDDKVLKEMVQAIPKDDLGWKELKIPEAYNDAPLKETIAKIPIYNDKELRETIAQQKRDFETVLAVADKNISETRKTLEQRLQELDKENKNLKETVQKQEKTIAETTKIAENTADKLKPDFKGKSGQAAISGAGLPNKVIPYTK